MATSKPTETLCRNLAALCLLLLAGCARSTQDAYAAGERLFQQGELPAAQAALPEHPSTPREQLLLAEIFLAQRKLAEATPLLQNTLSDPALETRRILDQAEHRFKSGQPDEALQLLSTAKQRAVNNPELLLRASVLEGPILASQKRFAEAKAALHDASQAAHQPYFQASALLNLSYVAVRESRFEDVIRYASEAVAAAEPIPARRILNGAYGNLALAYTQLGQFEDAASYSQRAADLQRAGQDWVNLEHNLGETGNLHALSGKFQDAIAAYQEAFQLAKQLSDPKDQSKWAGNLASAYLELGDPYHAAEWNETSRQLKVAAADASSLIYVDLNTADLLTARQQTEPAEAIYRRLINNTAADASLRWAAQAGLARLLSTTARTADADRAFHQALTTIERARTEIQRDDFRITFLARLYRFHDEFIRYLIAHHREAEALQAVEASRATVLAARTNLTAEAAPATDPTRIARASGATVLSYWIGPHQSALWIITPAGVRYQPLPSRAQIVEWVQSYRRSIEQSTADPLRSEAGAALYRELIAPAQLAPNARVILIPDGPLHELNFETLPSNGHYWIEDATVTVGASLNLLAAASPKASTNTFGKALLIGDPESTDPRYPRLQHAPAELQQISATVDEQLLTGKTATPDAFRAAHPEQFSVLHFAAHAESNPVRPLDSAIILSPGERGTRLTARDIMQQSLRAQLVTISACSSAAGRTYEGEGMVGIAWAFLHTGAPTVIASLWEVSDQSTAALMGALYQRISHGEPPSTALRAAKLDLLHSKGTWRQPYYWGTFQTFIRTP